MTIAPAPQFRDLDAEQQRDIARFELAVEQYLSGEISEAEFLRSMAILEHDRLLELPD